MTCRENWNKLVSFLNQRKKRINSSNYQKIRQFPKKAIFQVNMRHLDTNPDQVAVASVNPSTEYLRSETEVARILKQWRLFRSDERFTDLTVVCKSSESVSLHRIVLASCSDFLAGLLKDREDAATIVLPECDYLDFLNLVQILYGEKVCSHDSGYPSADLLQLLRITSFPVLEKGTPYADSGTESADPELVNFFQCQPHDPMIPAPDCIAPPTPFMDRMFDQENVLERHLEATKRKAVGGGKPNGFLTAQLNDSRSTTCAEWSDEDTVHSDWSEQDVTAVQWSEDDQDGMKSGENMQSIFPVADHHSITIFPRYR